MSQNERLLNVAEASKRLGVSILTLRRWDASGKLRALRTPGGHRRYRESDILTRQGIDYRDEPQQESVAIYTRVSSHEQKQKGDLDRQKSRLLEYCVSHHYKINYVFSEVGSGMSDTRPKLRCLFKLVTEKKITKIVIEHKDRLSRFMFNVFQEFFESQGVTIEWTEEVFPQSYEAELVTDMLTLLSSFSAKIYGKRSAARKKAKRKGS